ncbi:DNA-binding transcriptional regulator, PucR family [Streptosporangium subroseum]|uniref:DNA-binding transcriptional regulator, PucR family n=1 Tax=Streptosporangium subroseum TaxID=106412 RepID=A0A239LXU3_9ACTN|nr:PucR family transcriptional regulator ligand-binding domain-containing protein [Streptosporangium subroseum]SNT34519.1 DNA-binding transcriptional regulator, PucR family [Streptosporangium subroseum]
MFTLGALVRTLSLELRVLVPGPPGVMEAEVTWVHTTELPDPSNYVRERELVLTNGLWIGQVTPAEFVASMKRAGAAGVMFGLLAATPTTPRELVDACREADLPLLEISPRVPFTAVSETVAAMYAEERQSVLVGMVRRGDALARAISRGAGASGVLQVLRRDHDLPLAVVDRMGRLLAEAGARLDDEQLQAVARGLARRPPALELELGPTDRATLFLVGAVGDVDAALICLRPVSALDRIEQDALEQAARFLSLEVAKQQAVQAIELRFASELLEMVLSGGRRAAEVPGRLQAFGVDAGGPLAVCAIAFAEGEAATLPGLAEVVGEFFVTEGVPVVVAGGTQDVVAVLSWRYPEDGLVSLAERLAGAVARRFTGRRPVVGLGGVADDSAGLREPLTRSRETCRVLRRSRGGPVARTFAELGTHRLLLGLQDAGALRGFADVVLVPMREHDVRRGGELEVTLRAFLDHDGHWAATAASLHVHVNTLRNRLSKITELTGRDVSRTEDRVDLFLALEADAMS